MDATLNCVHCFKPDPTCGGGHVHKGDERLIAQYCKECKDVECLDTDHRGCFGQWTEEMGVYKDFISIGYITA